LEPHAVAGFTLLHQSARPDAWRQWLAQAGVHDADCMKGQRYELHLRFDKRRVCWHSDLAK
jgi:hypothetical protein